jgi:hypothetical protein
MKQIKPWLRVKNDPGRLKFKDNFEDLTFRHCEFNKTANPSTEKFDFYKDVIRSSTSKFLFKNCKFCLACGIDISDLRSMAQIWMCNFCGLYEKANEDSDNKKKFHSYLTQRFIQYRQYMEKRCLSLGITNKNREAFALLSETKANSIPSYEEIRIPTDKEFLTGSKKEIKSFLVKATESLDHAGIIKKMWLAANNQSFSHKERSKMIKKLINHVSQCNCVVLSKIQIEK